MAKERNVEVIPGKYKVLEIFTVGNCVQKLYHCVNYYVFRVRNYFPELNVSSN